MVEDGGRPIHIGLKVRDPMRPKGCIFNDPTCFVDSNSECDRCGVVYKITCIKCTETADNDREVHNYIGMTRTSLHNRMQGHLTGRRRKSRNNPLYRHDTDIHSGELQNYFASIVATDSKIVWLYCNEALRIEKQDPKYSINDRNEGGRGFQPLG